MDTYICLERAFLVKLLQRVRSCEMKILRPAAFVAMVNDENIAARSKYWHRCCFLHTSRRRKKNMAMCEKRSLT